MLGRRGLLRGALGLLGTGLASNARAPSFAGMAYSIPPSDGPDRRWPQFHKLMRPHHERDLDTASVELSQVYNRPSLPYSVGLNARKTE